MGAFIVRRLVQTVFVLLIVTFIAFMLLHIIPGDPVISMLGEEATQEQLDALRAELWLDQPLLVQYGHWMNGIFHGDFGKSLMYRDKVINLVFERLPISIYLSAWAMLVGTFFGIVFGIFSALKRGTFLDQAVTVGATIGIATPQFWVAVLLVYAIGLKLGWLPLSGWTSPFEDFWLCLRQSIMPIACLCFGAGAGLARQMRSVMLEIIHEDYIRTARAKGLTERSVIFIHALKNALIPIVTMIALGIPRLFGGAVLIEVVFNIPGIGRLLVNSTFDRDYVVVQASVLMIGVVISLSNLAADISYAYLDPRIRYD